MPLVLLILLAAVAIAVGAAFISELLDRIAKAAARRDIDARGKQRGRL